MVDREHARLIGEYRNGAKLLDAALARIPREMWTWRSDGDPWTIHDHVVHLADSEANLYIRMRKAIAEPGVQVDVYDQDAWQASGIYAHQDLELARKLFAILRLQTETLLEALPDEVWQQAIEHPENGRQTLAGLAATAIQHLSGHLAQIEVIHGDWVRGSR